VTVQDILPATMNYVIGSASIVPTSVVKNPDDTTTITWDLGSRMPNQPVNDITYKASIRPDAANNSTSVNTAIISSPDDATAVSARTRTASVTIGNPASFKIFKEVDRTIVDRNTGIAYYLYYANTGSTNVGTSQYIDILPHIGDGRVPPTVFSGSSVYNSISGTNGETFEFTNRPQSQINPDPNDASNQAGGSTVWCPTIGTPGCPTTNGNVTAIRISALAFNAGAPTRKLTLNISTNSNNSNDIYTNRFTGRANGLLGLLISNDVYSRVRLPAKVLLSKRITAINGTAIASQVFDTNTTEDKHPNWPANYLKGAIDGGKVKPGDELEYTIYFMNTGDNNATNIKICDLLQPNQSFQPDKYATGSGIKFKLGLDPVLNFTNIVDPIDRGQFMVADNNPLPSTCNLPTGKTNNNGAIVVDVTGGNGTGNPQLVKMPGATAPGTPSNSYGYIRFTTKVN
jgi:uncharacterized repeat protein (TIGR01451 family)